MRRFQKAKEIIQSDRFGNVVDFFQSSGIISGQGQVQQTNPVQQKVMKQDYTPLYILGAIAVLVAIIKK